MFIFKLMLEDITLEQISNLYTSINEFDEVTFEQIGINKRVLVLYDVLDYQSGGPDLIGFERDVDGWLIGEPIFGVGAHEVVEQRELSREELEVTFIKEDLDRPNIIRKLCNHIRHIYFIKWLEEHLW